MTRMANFATMNSSSQAKNRISQVLAFGLCFDRRERFIPDDRFIR